MWTLGINWKWHDSAAALVDEAGRIVAFAEEERFSRVKRAWGAYPVGAAQYCLNQAGITWRDLDAVAIGWDLPRLLPWRNVDREALYRALFGADAAGSAGPELVFVEHHVAHALSAYHASGFDRAGLLIVDGAGERDAISIFTGRDGAVAVERRWHRAHSLGALYEAATKMLGLGELNAGKTMGLASYGVAPETELLSTGDLLDDESGDSAPRFDWPDDLHYRDFTAQWMKYLADRFGTVTLPPEQLHQDRVAVRLAASVQRTVEEAIRALHAETVCLTGSPAVCLAGGVALNCVANGLLPEPLYVPPFAHDAGVALGAAWSVHPPRQAELLPSPYLGSELRTGGEIDLLRESGFLVGEFSPGLVVARLLQGDIGGIAEGRAEIGPRALGHRSIVAVPRPAATRDRINAVKGREPWRPLAPVAMISSAHRLWPGQGARELYMNGSTVIAARGRREMPAAVHVDGSARPQALAPGQAPVVESLLLGLEAAGAPPVLVNTSFNGPGEPIVNSAADAANTFAKLGLDFLVLGEHLIVPSARS